MAKHWECKYCDGIFPPRNFDGDMVCGSCGAEWEDAKIEVDSSIYEKELAEYERQAIENGWDDDWDDED